MLRLTRLRLIDFRNYAQLNWDIDPGPPGRIVVLTGPNGSGKTNLLEAISLLVPGRGLRNARIGELARRAADAVAAEWGVAGRFMVADRVVEAGTGGRSDSPERRNFLLNGAPPRSQAEIAAVLAAVWLTPQMDRLFQEPPSGRRRFLDRLVYALEPGHARELAAHDTAMAQRMKLLQRGAGDGAWLAGLEDSIARHAVAVTAARAMLVRRLNEALDADAVGGFPTARIALDCPIAARLVVGSALAAEDWLREALAATRRADAASGSAAFGAQRADMTLFDAETGRTAALASTGQRKALLIGLILGHAVLIGQLRGSAPILLLDEPMVHLDAARRRMLCAAIGGMATQCFLTGTDLAGFEGLHTAASFVTTGDGLVG